SLGASFVESASPARRNVQLIKSNAQTDSEAVIMVDAVGYLASSLVFVTFYMKVMVRLRIVAVCSNIAFLSYGLARGLLPVFVLHAALLPVNAWRLWEALRSDRLAGENSTGETKLTPSPRIR